MIRFKYLIGGLLIIAIVSCQLDLEKEKRSILIEKEEFTEYENLINNDFLIDDQHSYLGFKIKYFGYSPVRGRFNSFDGTLFYDTSSLNSISTTVYIDVNSINTGNESRDSDLKKEESWFNLPQFPVATFQSNNVKLKDDGGFVLEGKLTIKGIEKTIAIDFEKPTSISRDWAKNEQVDFTGKCVINRQDFEVYGGDFWSSVMEDGLTQLSDEVEIELNMHCRKPDYKARYHDALDRDLDKIILDHILEFGIDHGLKFIDSLNQSESVSSGKLSTVGYTLLEWKMYDEARSVFEKKKDLYGESIAVQNQLGIYHLLVNKYKTAHETFNQVLELDSTNSRSIEYLRLIKSIE